MDLASTLEVKHVGSDNVLRWTAQTNIMGYQIWRASTWVKVTDIETPTTTTYTDLDQPASEHYLVTAYTAKTVAGGYLGATAVNMDGGIPGYISVPTGKTADTSSTSSTSNATSGTQSTVPGFEIVALVAALGAAVVLLRRRLP